MRLTLDFRMKWGFRPYLFDGVYGERGCHALIIMAGNDDDGVRGIMYLGAMQVFFFQELRTDGSPNSSRPVKGKDLHSVMVLDSCVSLSNRQGGSVWYFFRCNGQSNMAMVLTSASTAFLVVYA